MRWSPSFRRLMLVLAAILLSAAPGYAQDQAQDQARDQGHNQTGRLANEVGLGLNFRKTIVVNRSELRTGREVETGQRVFRQLLSTSYVRSGDAFPYQLTILNSDEFNATSHAGGQIFAEGGIARLMNKSPALWAALLSHEIAHTLLHHHFRAHLRQEAIREEIALHQQRHATGDETATWALLALRLSGGLADLRLSRNEEYEADRLGLLIMAEAGYHPDFAVTGFRRVAMKTDEWPKLRAFFASHPRWEPHAPHQVKSYAEAVAVFDARWPNASKSPGGQPPVVATIMGVAAEKLRENRKALIRGTLHVRNARNRTLFIVVKFFHRERPVPVTNDAPESYNIGGNGLETGFRASLNSDDETTGIALTVPTAIIGIRERQLKARLSVLDGEGNILDSTKEFVVNFPN